MQMYCTMGKLAFEWTWLLKGVSACVLTLEGMSGIFACTTVVKQGSPLFFGLDLDDLKTLVMRSASRDSPILPTGLTPAPHGVED